MPECRQRVLHQARKAGVQNANEAPLPFIPLNSGERCSGLCCQIVKLSPIKFELKHTHFFEHHDISRTHDVLVYLPSFLGNKDDGLLPLP